MLLPASTRDSRTRTGWWWYERTLSRVQSPPAVSPVAAERKRGERTKRPYTPLTAAHHVVNTEAHVEREHRRAKGVQYRQFRAYTLLTRVRSSTAAVRCKLSRMSIDT